MSESRVAELQNLIDEAMDQFKEGAVKGNKASRARARKASLVLEKLFKEYRKLSVKL